MNSSRTKLLLLAVGLGLAQPLVAVTPVTITPPGPITRLDAGAGNLWIINNCAITTMPTEAADETPRFGTFRNINPCPPSAVVVGEFAPATASTGFHLNADGAMRKVLAGSSLILSTSPNPSAVRSESRVALSPNFVYWSEVIGEIPVAGRIYRASNSAPGTPETVTGSGAAGSFVLQLHAPDDSTLFVLFSNGNLVRFSRSVFNIGGTPIVTWGSRIIDGSVTAFQTHGPRIYWCDHSSDNRSQFFRSAPFSDVTETTLHTFDFNSTPRTVKSFVFDGRSFYYQSQGGGSSGPIKRAPAFPRVETAFEITSIFPSISGGLHSGVRYIYWQDGNALKRIPIGAAAVERDFRAISMEIIQSVQSTANDVDLIIGKPTTVRLLAALSGEETSATLTPGALLYGSASDGSPLPGSPLAPMGFPPIFNRPHVRTDPSEGFNFSVPDEWTRRGTVTLRGTINPTSALNETTRSNNSLTVTREFLRKAPVTLWFHPLRTRAGTIGGTYLPWMEPHFERAASLLPTSGIIPVFRGGRVLEEYNFPASYEPYDLPSGTSAAGLEAMKINFKLASRWRRSSDPDIANRTNSRVIHSAMVPPSVTNWGIGGQAFPHGHSMLTNMWYGDITSTFDEPRGGQTMAHEISHSHGVGHNCITGIENFPTDGDYPYGCSFTDGTDIGYDFFSRQFVIADGIRIGDTMSYNADRWASDYNWRRLTHGLDRVRRISTMPEGVTFPEGRAKESNGAGAESRYLISGFYDPESGENLLPGIIPVTAEILARATEDLASPLADLTGYELVGLEKSGDILFSIPPARTRIPEIDKAFSYLALIDSIEGLARVELRPKGSANVLSSVDGGGSPPVTVITTPLAGAIVSGDRLDIEWSSSDPDGDNLTHTIRYSFDDGSSWQTVIADTPLTSVSLDTAELPGAAKSCRIEVITSDGILTVSDTVAALTIPAKAPQIYIFTETEKARSCDLVGDVFLSAGDFLALRTRCVDREDGTLPDSSLKWSLTGRVTRSAVGPRWNLADLLPGDYTATVTATDSDGLTGTAKIRISVAARFVSGASSPLVLDGYADEAAWMDDRHPTEIRYAASVENAASVRMVIENGKLLVALDGLSNGTNSGEFVGITVDLANGNPNSPNPGDLRFDVFSDGRTASLRGNGTSGFTTDPDPLGFDARVSRNSDHWSAELAINLERIGGPSATPIGIAVGHYHRNFSGDDRFWPASAVWNRPSTWADVVLSANPDEPFDGDGDRMPDSWELTNLGTTAGDGSGDRDGDGQSDAAEYLAGTSPRDPADLLKVATFTLSTGLPRLTFETVGGRSYSVESSSDLQTWAPVEVGLPASPSPTIWVVPDNGRERRFFRIRAHYCR